MAVKYSTSIWSYFSLSLSSRTWRYTELFKEHICLAKKRLLLSLRARATYQGHCLSSKDLNYAWHMYLHLQFKSNIGKYMYGKYTIHGFYASVPNPRFSGEPWRRPAVPHGLVLWGSCCVSQDLGSKGAAFLGLPKLCRDRLGQWWLWMVLAVSFQSLTVWCLIICAEETCPNDLAGHVYIAQRTP